MYCRKKNVVENGMLEFYLYLHYRHFQLKLYGHKENRRIFIIDVMFQSASSNLHVNIVFNNFTYLEAMELNSNVIDDDHHGCDDGSDWDMLDCCLI